MGVLFMATADLQDLGILDGYSTSFVTISSDYARTGAYSFKTISNGGYILASFAATSDGYMKVAFSENAASAASGVQVELHDATVQHLTIQWLGVTRTLSVYRGSSSGTLLGTVPIPGAVSGLGNWNVLEVHWTIHDSTGVVQVKMNGALAIDISGADTQNAGAAEVTYCKAVNVGTTQVTYFDDFVVRDDAWPGRGGLHVIVPNAGSANENWTASAGNPEDCVDELPPSFTDYISTAALTPDTEHLVGLASLAITSSTISAVGIFVNAQTTEATSANIHTMMVNGGTTTLGATTPVDTTAIWATSFYAVNPDDAAAFEDADIDAMEIGVETE